MRPSRPLRSISVRRAPRLARAALALTLGLAAFAPRTAAAAGAASAASEPAAPSDGHASTAPAEIERGPRFADGGDFGGYLVERFGGLVLPSAAHGQSGSASGSGLETRYMMPVGWGAYFRYARAVQTKATSIGTDAYAWDQWDLTFGFSKRLQATRQRPAFREQTRFDLGFAYSQAGTNAACTNSAFTWAITCASGSANLGHGLNASGAAVGLEARLALEIGVGPVGLGIDFGGAAYKSVTHGANSDSLPTLFFAWSAQARAGLAWTMP